MRTECRRVDASLDARSYKRGIPDYAPESDAAGFPTVRRGSGTRVIVSLSSVCKVAACFAPAVGDDIADGNPPQGAISRAATAAAIYRLTGSFVPDLHLAYVLIS